MLISTNTHIMFHRFGHKDTLRMVAEAGFPAYDMSFFSMFSDPEDAFNKEDYRQYAAELRAYADQLGVVCNQAHAPFDSSTGDEVKDEEKFQAILRAMEAAAILGAKYIVVHPCQHLVYAEEGNPEKLREINIAFYKRLLPYCEKFGIKIATENMWQWDSSIKKIVHSTCSRPAEFVDYIDSVNSPNLVACLDVGHAMLVNEPVDVFIKALGAQRLKALHIHDVDGHSDLHTLPFLAKIKWAKVTDALKSIGYDGDLTFESNNYFKAMPDPLMPHALRFMYETGKYLASQITGENM